MRILHLDTNHPLMLEQLGQAGYENVEDYHSSKEVIEQKIDQFEGMILRSRFPIDRKFLEKASRLKFIGRVGAGLENIDQDAAWELGVKLINAPEGNANAVGEHNLGMLLMLINRLQITDREVRNGLWLREENRGVELDNMTVGLVGYGHMGKAFAKKLQGFECRVICYDIQSDVGDQFAHQVSLEELKRESDVISLHVPLTDETRGIIDQAFIKSLSKPVWLLNTARGRCVVTADLVKALDSGKVLGAGLDVLEYEKRSFESLFENGIPEAFQALLDHPNVVLSPHVAGWTHESKEKLAQTIVNKILALNLI
ncbi:2-hydroxyacid dehydrogenase [Aureitalea marina]|uniref:Hydroxyacid dehydrogenase n=1 Tax=Aureitalea marina TaxID=930804 RepID=A0A2S7KRJ8_9FLAO|nr:2-hydroxyacid dehydrogenase [Aureitalea marina]PQB05255.1 hydroxyacid dehydrogenase [Aureitalea marina]